jgi:hypothetical protein
VSAIQPQTIQGILTIDSFGRSFLATAGAQRLLVTPNAPATDAASTGPITALLTNRGLLSGASVTILGMFARLTNINVIRVISIV